MILDNTVDYRVKRIEEEEFSLDSIIAFPSQRYAWDTNPEVTMALRASMAILSENAQPQYQIFPFKTSSIGGGDVKLKLSASLQTATQKSLLNGISLYPEITDIPLPPELRLPEIPLSERDWSREGDWGAGGYFNFLRTQLGKSKFAARVDRTHFYDVMEMIGVFQTEVKAKGYLSTRKDILYAMEQAGDFLPNNVKESVLDTLAHMSKDQRTFNEQFNELMDQAAPLSLNQALEKARGFAKPRLMTFSRALAELGIYPTEEQINDDRYVSDLKQRHIYKMVQNSRKDGEWGKDIQESLLAILSAENHGDIEQLLNDDKRSVDQIIKDLKQAKDKANNLTEGDRSKEPNFKQSLTILGIDPTDAYLGKRNLLDAIDSVICHYKDRGTRDNLRDYINEAAPDDEVKFKHFIQDLYAANRYSSISDLLEAHREAQTPEPSVEEPLGFSDDPELEAEESPKARFSRGQRVIAIMLSVLALSALAAAVYLGKTPPQAGVESSVAGNLDPGIKAAIAPKTIATAMEQENTTLDLRGTGKFAIGKYKQDIGGKTMNVTVSFTMAAASGGSHCLPARIVIREPDTETYAHDGFRDPNDTVVCLGSKAVTKLGMSL